ncbi:MAG: penicillin-binding protein [Lachnospiraceae bacterium]|nr:penicillin-binding protein [Lachnospiraceae bacterium]
MFEDFKENFLNMLTSRVFVMILIMAGISSVIIHRLFDLQIVNGETYLNSFQTKIMKERTIQGSRGNIYDRNGNLLAYNELAHSVKIEDVYESGKMKNYNLNSTIFTLIQMIEANGDKTVQDFKIVIDNSGNYAFTVEGTQLLRFLADVYGHTTIDKLEEKEKTATASEVVDYLCGWDRFRIGEYTQDDNKDSFVPGNGLTKAQTLKILSIRYDMNNNSYQKYIGTTVATDVSEATVAVVMENCNELEGVTIVEDTIRKYVDSVYFAHILGYTGKVSQEELATLLDENGKGSYDLNDIVGKLGIEKSMETYLQGKKGSETVFVNSVGKVIETSNYIEPVAGNDIYLTIDKDLQITAYKILEEKLASILYSNIINAKEFDKTNTSSSNIKIPIYDVYCALINNNIIDISHFESKNAKEHEIEVYENFLTRKQQVFDTLNEEFFEKKTPYNKLKKEYQVYQSFIAKMLYDNGIINRSLVDSSDKTYIAWTTEETISLTEYINYCISMNWVDVTRLSIENKYADSEEIFESITEYIYKQLNENEDFFKKVYQYMIKGDVISGTQICHILIEQNVVEIEEEELDRFMSGKIKAFQFMMNRIREMDITPAQLALDPHSASMVMTDVNTGEVLALVTYPGYDNNKMANGVDAEYFAQLLNDLSTPMINYATQQKTAPGSTFKMVSSTAGLKEDVITTTSTFTCHGQFNEIEPPPRCWIYGKGSHGAINVANAIRHSCNVYFYELGYKLGIVGETYTPDVGLQKLAHYADMYGLSETSGIEIEESVPQISDTDPVRSAIGQGTNSFTTVGLARYVTAVANSGTCYDLTLVDKITDRGGNLLLDNQAKVRNNVDMDTVEWNAIHNGMRQVIESKAYYNDLEVKVAGKTGTAEEDKSRPNHALFVCYAPYEEPEIAIATRIAFGYTSTYAAQLTKDIISYHFDLKDKEELITGTAVQMNESTAVTD